jgi:hypothetical protein
VEIAQVLLGFPVKDAGSPLRPVAAALTTLLEAAGIDGS